MSTPSEFRTDRNNNPTAFTTSVAAEAGLILGTDYAVGDPFEAGDAHTLRPGSWATQWR